MSTWLVTGGAGFIGSHLVDALFAGGHRVRVLDDLSSGRRDNLPPEAELILGDVADPTTVHDAMTGVDGCFHLAAIASVARANEDWLGTSRINLGGALSVFEAARRHGGTPVVYASSAAVYGRIDGTCTEDSPTAPLSSYGADKRAVELHAAAGFTVHAIPSVGFRFFNVYGPRQDPSSPYSGVISLFASALLARRPITLHGDGTQTRDFIWVGDVVDFLQAGMAHAAATPAALVLNACTGRATAIRDLATAIGGLLQHTPAMARTPPRPGDIPRSLGDPARARTALGLEARTALADGLARTLQAGVALERA